MNLTDKENSELFLSKLNDVTGGYSHGIPGAASHSTRKNTAAEFGRGDNRSSRRIATTILY
jgi:hypothetical protein